MKKLKRIGEREERERMARNGDEGWMLKRKREREKEKKFEE